MTIDYSTYGCIDILYFVFRGSKHKKHPRSATWAQKLLLLHIFVEHDCFIQAIRLVTETIIYAIPHLKLISQRVRFIPIEGNHYTHVN